MIPPFLSQGSSHADIRLKRCATSFGATVIDVRIEHAIYGELTAKLDLSSRYDVDVFVDKVEHENNSAPISSLTGGVHLHSIGCRDSQSFERIKAALSDKGFLMN